MAINCQINTITHLYTEVYMIYLTLCIVFWPRLIVGILVSGNIIICFPLLFVLEIAR